MACDTEQLRALIAAATQGPWKACPSIENDFFGVYPDTGRREFPISKMPEFIKAEVNEANAALIVVAVNNLEPLLSTNEALARENERLREGLKPFGECELHFPGAPSETHVECISDIVEGDYEFADLTVGDFRRARLALEPSMTSEGLNVGEMRCPDCGGVAESDMVDIGIGVQVRGNFRCPCGFAIEPPTEHDLGLNFPEDTP